MRRCSNQSGTLSTKQKQNTKLVLSRYKRIELLLKDVRERLIFLGRFREIRYLFHFESYDILQKQCNDQIDILANQMQSENQPWFKWTCDVFPAVATSYMHDWLLSSRFSWLTFQMDTEYFEARLGLLNAHSVHFLSLYFSYPVFVRGIDFSPLIKQHTGCKWTTTKRCLNQRSQAFIIPRKNKQTKEVNNQRAFLYVFFVGKRSKKFKI